MPLAVQGTRVRGTWLKHAPPGLPPLPLRTDPPDNRWQRGHVVDAIYLADSEETAWAEWYRKLAEYGIPPVRDLPRDLWRWRVDVEVADLTTKRRLEAVGLPAPTPGRWTWPPFQEVGEQLWREGRRGLVAPSAALRAGRVLCLFWDGADELEGAEPQGRPVRVEEPPPPPRGLTT